MATPFCQNDYISQNGVLPSSAPDLLLSDHKVSRLLSGQALELLMHRYGMNRKYIEYREIKTKVSSTLKKKISKKTTFNADKNNKLLQTRGI